MSQREPVDVFYAVFRSKQDVVDDTVARFRRKFGEEVYGELAPFIERRGVRYVFGARSSKYKNIFLRGLTRAVAKFEQVEPVIPDLEDTEYPTGTCGRCGVVTDLRFISDMNQNDSRPLCNVCYAEINEAAHEVWKKKLGLS